MKWEDEGILLSTRKNGEHNAIIEVFTATYGRHAGFVKYAYSPKTVSLLEPGMQLRLVWSARLNEHLGTFSIDKVKTRTSTLIRSKQALLGFNSLVALILFCFPDREPLPKIYEATIKLVDSMNDNNLWLEEYVRWELLILTELGFGLDLSKCAVTGENTNLTYVSPKTGRAVSSQVGKKWADKLITLPKFLISSDEPIEQDPKMIFKGMTLTGYFLKKWLTRGLEKSSLPEARHRFFISLID